MSIVENVQLVEPDDDEPPWDDPDWTPHGSPGDYR